MSRFTLVIAIAAALVAGMWLGSTLLPREPLTVHGTVLEPPRRISDFRLVDHRGRPFSLTSLQGKWSFLFFGYTHCPDICSTTLHTLAQMDDILRREQPDIHEQTQVVFVSVDPQRDSSERLATYVPYFGSGFIGVTGSSEAIERLTRELGILHMRVERGEGKGYLVEHSSAILLFDPQGRQRAVLTAPHQAATLAEDFRQLAEHET
jgi:protein SCO1/2